MIKFYNEKVSFLVNTENALFDDLIKKVSYKKQLVTIFKNLEPEFVKYSLILADAAKFPKLQNFTDNQENTTSI